MDHSKDISNTPEGVLVRLKEQLRKELGIDFYSLKMLIDKFVVSTFHGINNSKTHFAKVNIFNEITKNKMTIKVFFKFLRIIKIKSVRISITVKTIKDTEHTVFDDINIFSIDDKEDNSDG